MILKDKTQTSSASIKLDAGMKQEQDVAFYLRRAYKDRDNVMVFNDIRLSHGGEHAQIDHLIVYSFGFIVVESKSIRGEVKVNEYSEWSRSYKGQWSGMPSPIKQAELQLSLLKQLLRAHDSQLLGTLLGMQQGFGGRCFDVFCAISSDAIIDRSKAPIDVADKLVKSEFVVEAFDKKMDFKTFFQLKARLAEKRPSFTSEELNKICNFIFAHTNNQKLKDGANPILQQPQVAATQYEVIEKLQSENTAPSNHSLNSSSMKETNAAAVQCKHCGASSGLTAQSGRYGYFVQCSACGGNTPLKRPCLARKSADTKVSKSKSVYSLNCQSCGAVSEVLEMSH
ncbi:MAG: NERD domain-containing protein [Gammaproteobacteria bacterium]|nr:NERD domain-containing protein [Gammaproteobacteria bacterium]